MKSFAELLKTNRAILLDGATGSNLIAAGMPKGVCPELWIIENPLVLIKLQSAYTAAGSDIILAPTFGANRSSLKRYNLDGRIEELNLKLFNITKEAVNGAALVAADISPTGLFMKPYGEASVDDVFAIYTEQAEILGKAGADLFYIETQISLAEAKVALHAIKSVTDKPVIVTLSVDKNGRSMSGDDLCAALFTLEAAGASAAGCNCSVGPGDMHQSLKKCRGTVNIPLIAKANAGMPHECGEHINFDVGSDEFAETAAKMAADGIKIIGGCCGTTPEYISKIKNTISGVIIKSTPTDEKYAKSTISTNKTLFTFDNGFTLPEQIKCTESLAEDIADAIDNGDDCVRIYFKNYSDVDIFVESLYALTVPLIADASDVHILEKILVNYVGRAAIDPETKLAENELLYIKNKYSPVSLGTVKQ